MDYRDFRMTEYEFIDRSPWPLRLWFFLLNLTDSLFHVIPVRPAITFRSMARWIRTPPLPLLCKIILSDDQQSPAILKYHQRRIRLRTYVVPLVYAMAFMPVYPILIGFALLIRSVIASLTQGPLDTLGQKAVFLGAIGFTVTISPLIFLFAFIVFVWFASAITDKYFADSLCIYSIVNLIIQLTPDDVLIHPRRKRILIRRMHHLARSTLLLTLHFRTKDPDNQAWIRKHFKQMELYIRERERWALAPNGTTLPALREDFYKLASTYLSANYGEFAWVVPLSTPDPVSLTSKHRLVALLRRLLAMILPLAVLGFLLWNPARLNTLGISTNVVALIFVAWLLLAIDAFLELGIVSSVVRLAKAIKDLT